MTLNYVPKMLSSASVQQQHQQQQQPQQQNRLNGTRSQRLHRKIINIIIAMMMVYLGYCIEGKCRMRDNSQKETFNYYETRSKIFK